MCIRDSAMTAKEFAAAITAQADTTGVSATAVTKVQLYNMNSASDISFRLFLSEMIRFNFRWWEVLL